jgi:lysophospholipase L1-like esterase
VKTGITPRQFLALALAWAASVVLWIPTLRAQTNSGPTKWEAEIRAFEAADRTNPPPSGAIVFVGSSSIRLWRTLAQDFSEFKVLNRGFGGSQIADSIAFANRIILPCQPRLVVLYAGDNDLATGKSPSQVYADFKAFVRKIRTASPKTGIVFISIKPSPARWALAEKVRAANQMIENYCKPAEGLTYIDVFNPMLGGDGKPRAELFLEDKLHLNARGYALWTEIIKPRLSASLIPLPLWNGQTRPSAPVPDR